MSEIAMNAAHMIDMLPDPDKNLAYELIIRPMMLVVLVLLLGKIVSDAVL